MFLGVLVMHWKTIGETWDRKSTGNAAIDEILDLVERGNFTPAEKRQQFRLLIERSVKQLVLNKDMARKVEAIERLLSEDRVDGE
jgi:hypothetical protein